MFNVDEIIVSFFD